MRMKGDRFYPQGTPFMEKMHFEPMSGCWIWGAAENNRGYGLATHNRGMALAHRMSYEMHRGSIPKGLVLDHLCRNRLCCNPDHLQVVTNKVNILRGICPTAINAKKTHCINGHEYTPENTKKHIHGRQCRTCVNEQARNHRKGIN